MPGFFDGGLPVEEGDVTTTAGFLNEVPVEEGDVTAMPGSLDVGLPVEEGNVTAMPSSKGDQSVLGD